jgi:hypothetical protein
MRSYPRNSPEAAARIVALVLIADGHVCRSEFEVFDRLDGPRVLGLKPDGFARIVQTLCEDLLMGDHAGGAMLGAIDTATLAALMAEVDDPALRRKVLRLAVAAARADRHLADGEALVLAAARRHWSLNDESVVDEPAEAAPQAA